MKIKQNLIIPLALIGEPGPGGQYIGRVMPGEKSPEFWDVDDIGIPNGQGGVDWYHEVGRWTWHGRDVPRSVVDDNGLHAPPGHGGWEPSTNPMALGHSRLADCDRDAPDVSDPIPPIPPPPPGNSGPPYSDPNPATGMPRKLGSSPVWN